MPFEITSYDELRRRGLTPGHVRTELQSGRLTRVCHAMYAPSTPLSPELHYDRLIEAQRHVLDGEGVISHFSAARILGWPVPRDRLDKLWVTRPGYGGGKSGAASVRHVHWMLGDDDVMMLDGHAVTTPTRTLADLLRRLTFTQGVIVADAALRSGVDRAAVDELLCTESRRWHTTLARRALAFANPLAESPLESRSRVLMAEYDVPPPILQMWFGNATEPIGRSDFGWLEERVLGECDGKVKYGRELAPGGDPAEAVWREKIREDRAREANYSMVRWINADFTNPDRLAVRWLHALGRPTDRLVRRRLG